MNKILRKLSKTFFVTYLNLYQSIIFVKIYDNMMHAKKVRKSYDLSYREYNVLTTM
jgi:hypothetical protein